MGNVTNNFIRRGDFYVRREQFCQHFIGGEIFFCQFDGVFCDFVFILGKGEKGEKGVERGRERKREEKREEERKRGRGKGRERRRVKDTLISFNFERHSAGSSLKSSFLIFSENNKSLLFFFFWSVLFYKQTTKQ